jgi:spore cortex formation protein SpoVR/YcgB (stage V sporulation)
VHKLEEHFEVITNLAKEMGLDPHPMSYEIVPREVLYAFGAYGLPTRFNHWSFGKALKQLEGSANIYELVINSSPCYAFLSENNTALENKLICAHVLGHSDFFKHNYSFKKASKDMLETMLLHGREMHEFEEVHGVEAVEKVIDAAMSIAEQPSVITFFKDHSEVLTPWQKRIFEIIAQEASYFLPQRQTKIMNEGWATLFHLKIMRKLKLSDEEVIDYAKMHASVITSNGRMVNPYLLGLRIFEDIEKTYGLAHCFKVRSTENDISFLRNYLTTEVMASCGLAGVQPKREEYLVTSCADEDTKDALINSLIHGGFPLLHPSIGEDGNFVMEHDFDGRHLDFKETEATMRDLYPYWGKPIQVKTKVEDRDMTLTCRGNKCSRSFITGANVQEA